MDQNMTLEKRIAAELYSYQGRMSVFVDDLRGSTVEIGADEEFETASTIKAFILAVLYLQASRGRADLEEEITYEASQFVDGSGMLRALGVGAKLKVKDTATMMIICSDNIATNMIIDYLGLDNSARINFPSTLGTNWRWRLIKSDLTKALADSIRKQNIVYGRVKWEDLQEDEKPKDPEEEKETETEPKQKKDSSVKEAKD